MRVNKRAKSMSQRLYTKISHMVFPTAKIKSKALTIGSNTDVTVHNIDMSDLTFEYFYHNDILVKIARTLLAKLTREELDTIIDNIKRVRSCEDRATKVSISSSKRLQKRFDSTDNGPNSSGGQSTGKTKHVPVISSMSSTSTEIVQKKARKVKRKGKGKWQESRCDKSSESYTGSKNSKSKKKNSKPRRAKSQHQEVINANVHVITDNAIEKKASPSKNKKQKSPSKKKTSSKKQSSSSDKGVAEQQQQPNKNSRTSEIGQKTNEDIEDKQSALGRSTYIKAAEGGRHIAGSLRRRRHYTRTRTRTNSERRSNERAKNSRGDGERVTCDLYEDTKREKEAVQKRLQTVSRPRRHRLRSLGGMRYSSRISSLPQRQESVVLMSTNYDE